MNAILLSLSFAGTKLLGPDRTARAFEVAGKVRKRLPIPLLSALRGRQRSRSEIAARVQRGLDLLPLPVECLDQAMVTWYQLNLRGHPATLKIGMKLSPLTGHAWVVSGDETFVVTPGLEDYAVVAEFDAWS
jgi:hypothetical protein